MVETERRLPEYFPLAPKACAVPAASFFDCFSAKGKQADDVAVRFVFSFSLQINIIVFFFFL